MPEVATVVDDVRYSGKSGLSADVEFPAEFDPKRTPGRYPNGPPMPNAIEHGRISTICCPKMSCVAA